MHKFSKELSSASKLLVRQAILRFPDGCINGFQLMRCFSPDVTLLDGNVSSAYGQHSELGSSRRLERRGGGRENHHLLSHSHDDAVHPEYLKRVADLLWIVKQTKAILPNQHPLSPWEPTLGLLFTISSRLPLSSAPTGAKSRREIQLCCATTAIYIVYKMHSCSCVKQRSRIISIDVAE